ncbi:helix-turn-helix domain-containing protein [Chitinophaga sp. CC14]|uniref:helix-turn-helix domain-containing protein n=1 Tax=Chitinophaga sp. CC14 TaxID=3029199 RepID=UPI003B806548
MKNNNKDTRTDKPSLLDPWITLADLARFKADLINEIKSILSEGKIDENRKWLKSFQVRQMLNISAGTLQTLRSNGTLPFTKIGGALYYEYKDIQNILDKAKVDKSKLKWKFTN